LGNKVGEEQIHHGKKEAYTTKRGGKDSNLEAEKRRRKKKGGATARRGEVCRRYRGKQLMNGEILVSGPREKKPRWEKKGRKKEGQASSNLKGN